MTPSDTALIEEYYHSALDACAKASLLEAQDRLTDALAEYRRSIALIKSMQQMAGESLHATDEAYFSGVTDVERLCKVHIAILESELNIYDDPIHQGDIRRKSNESLNTIARSETSERTRRTTGGHAERSKTSRSPSPEKKEKKSMPLTLRSSKPVLTRVSSADKSSAPSVSQAAVEASRAATLAWQSKKTNGTTETRRTRNRSPTSNRVGCTDDMNTKRQSVSDTTSLLDSPLIDFSTSVLSTSAPPTQEPSKPIWTPISPTRTPPPHSPQTKPEPHSPTRRKSSHTPRTSQGRSNANVLRPTMSLKSPSQSHPLSVSTPQSSESVDPPFEPSPTLPSKSDDESVKQELSREEKVLQELKGVDQNLARTILSDIVVRGDEVHWDDIAGLEEAKNSLKETVIYPFLRPDLFSGLREPAQGILLFGPPGTGKTMLARAVATQAKSTFFSISASTIVSKYYGESEKLVKALFALAKKLSPSIIFIDEVDSILSTRSGGDKEGESMRRLKSEFLIQWSGLASAAAARASSSTPRVLVLAATNLPWLIDDAARRRFVLRQYIPLPEWETRRVQFTSLLKKQHHELTDEQLDELIRLTKGFSGSDITALTKDAAMGPLRSLGEALLTTKREEIRAITFEDFVVSLKKVRPSVSKKGLYAFEKWNDEFGSKG